MRRRKPASPPDKARIGWLAPLIVATLTFLTFLPVLWNEFVWDDFRDLVQNQYYRGLGWTQLRWMFSIREDHYYPLTWMTHALDYLIFGLNPVGHHLTNLVLHTGNAVVFYFIARRLIGAAVAAAFAALLFAVHPLRVESVAWATERKDVLSGLFFLLTILFYLRRQMTGVFVCYVAALLSKSIAITLPPVLLLLDVYVLKRPWSWRVLLEKAALVLIAAPFALASWLGESSVPFDNPDITTRLLRALYAVSFYLWKTLAPFNLSTIYEMPVEPMADPIIILGAIAAIGPAVGMFFLRHTLVWPCWLYMLLLLGPVLGIVQTGGHDILLVADRYSYLSCLSWAVLAGGLLLRFLRGPVKTRKEKRRGDVQRPVAWRATGAAIIILALSALTWQQTKIWRNSETFFLQALKVDPNSTVAHYNFAEVLTLQGKTTEAILHLHKALSLRPNGSNTLLNRTFLNALWSHWGLAGLLARQGKAEESEEHFKQWLYLTRNVKLGTGRERIRNEIIASENGEAAAKYHALLAKALARQGQAEKAEAHFKKAIELNPNLPFCVLNFCQ